MSDLSATALATQYLGLELSGPIVASASPLTGDVETLKRLEAAGTAAVVLPSLFEEEVIDEELSLHASLEQGRDSFPESMNFLPEVNLGELGPDRHVRLVSEAKAALGIPVIASVNAAHRGSWSRYATMLGDAGADAIELNIYAVAADPRRSAADVEAGYLEIISEVKSAVQVPLTVKLSPYFSSTAHFAASAVDVGANGLVLFNRFYQPDLDLQSLSVQPRVDLSDARELRLPLRWLAILRPQLPSTSLAASSGVHSAADVLKTLLVGADVACMTSAVLRHGPEHVASVLTEIRRWLTERDYESIAQLRGSLSAAGAEDPSAFERSNYRKVLSSYQPVLTW